MKSLRRKNTFPSRSGFTLIELAIAIAIIGLLAAFAFLSFGTAGEDRDAAMVQSSQASLQTIVSQGATRMDLSPQALRDSHPQQILLAVQAAIGQTAGKNADVQFSLSGTNFVMTIPKSGRTATFTITDTGEVQLTNLSSNFTGYKPVNGVIQKI
jgi:prepilin-type N-terminal cleavage/methylation domain-containing protein